MKKKSICKGDRTLFSEDWIIVMLPWLIPLCLDTTQYSNTEQRDRAYTTKVFICTIWEAHMEPFLIKIESSHKLMLGFKYVYTSFILSELNLNFLLLSLICKISVHRMFSFVLNLYTAINLLV